MKTFVFWLKNFLKLIVGSVLFVFGGFLNLGFLVVDDAFESSGSVPLVVAVVSTILGTILLLSFVYSVKKGAGMKKFKYTKNKLNPSEYIILCFIGIGIGAFFLYQLYLRWDTYHILNRVVMGCLGAFFIFLPVSKRLCALVVEILILLIVFYSVSPEFRNLWTGKSSFSVRNLSAFILSILAFGIPILLFIVSIFHKLRRSSISMSDVDLMSGSEFEQFCADVLRKNGFHDVQVMGGSGDQGVDIVATKKKLRYAIQCKCYSSNLGNTPVQEVFAGRVHYGCDVAAVMTNSYFTAGAVELARSTGVFLWDRDWVYNHLSARSKQKTQTFVPIDAEIATTETFSSPEPEPVPEMESVKSEKTLEEILEETKAERMARLEEIRKEIREKEKQEEYLKTIYGEEMKWRREQLHGGTDEDSQE